jgi:hypothetical protein
MRGDELHGYDYGTLLSPQLALCGSNRRSPIRMAVQSRHSMCHVLAQAFDGRRTDPSCSWVLDYLVRTLPPWRGAYPARRQRQLGAAQGQATGGGDDGQDGGDDGVDGPTGGRRSAKRRRGAPPDEDPRDDDSASHERRLRSGTILPSRRVMALPDGCIDNGRSSCCGLPGGMPPRELDYGSELSGGFVLGMSHFQSPVCATRCDSPRLGHDSSGETRRLLHCIPSPST